jgi:AraC-like DNA-binding protein
MVNYTTQKPMEELSDYIRFFWTLDVNIGSVTPFVHRALPDNCLELIFYCRGNFSITSPSGDEGHTFPSGVFGHAQKFRQFKTNSDFTLFGVYLYPHSFKALFNLPAHELTNQMVDSETLWGVEGKILEEKIMLAANDKIRVSIFSDFLFNRIRNKLLCSRESAFVGAINEIITHNRLVSIPTFASECNLSRRQFERKFREFSGFSPKDFLRLVRFRNAVKESGCRNKSLVQIANDSGYYDQSHFTHEFKKFSGYTPREFFINCPEATDTRVTRDFKN